MCTLKTKMINLLLPFFKMSDSIFVYSWAIDEKQKDVTSIRAYGLNSRNENVCLRIDDFTPYVYLELPTHISWTESKARIVVQRINEIMKELKPLKSSLVMRRKLYYSFLDSDGNHSFFPFLFLAFSSKSDITNLSYRIKDGLKVPNVGLLKIKMHEQKATPILQMICAQGIPSCGWIGFKGTKIPPDECITLCTHEYNVKWKHTFPIETEAVVNPLVMCFDLEVYSSNPNKMPSASNPRDKIFQMSCVFFRIGDNETRHEKYLFSLGMPDQEVVGKNVTVIRCQTEADLLEGYAKIINEKNPNIICGYNIFKFDIPYMLDRAKSPCNILNIFDKHGFTKYNHAQERTIKWSSTAFKNQEFSYLDAEGRLFVDLLPLVQREHKFSSYSLKSVSDYFLGETKDPLDPKGIFRCYDLGMKGGEAGARALGIVGKYCVQDSALVAKLFDKLQTWFGLSEMAKICNVSIFTLYTQGQQIKVYSQVYKKCMAENIVVESEGYVPGENDHYQGAHVFEPIPGVYDCVVPFDFASLYPSIIIAYNIDFTTLIPQNSPIEDKDCHVFEWSEHVGCEHDTTRRKTKVKHVLCGSRKFRFLKTKPGILPTILEDLLSARKKTRNYMKEIENKISKCTNEDEKQQYIVLLNVLDKRQLSYKISANSMYGSLGVQAGYLPLMPGAMCVTAVGRKSILKVADTITGQYGAKIILGDTDSVYCVFEQFGNDTAALWAHCEKVSSEISKLFPKPMKLEFEGKIYWRFLTLTKKRYMSLECDRNGVVSREIKKKGVLLTRRDNSNFVRSVYADCIMQVFDKIPADELLYSIVQQFNKLCSNSFKHKDFVITKSVGSTTVSDSGVVSVVKISDQKGLVGDYKVPLLAEIGSKKREKQFALKNASTEDEYYLRCLPSQVQLSEKMKRRGKRVDAGTRLEFVIVNQAGSKSKLYERIESWDYFKEHVDILRLDFLYYLKAITTQLDQVLACTIGIESFGKSQLELRTQKQKIMSQIKMFSQPAIIMEVEEVV